MRHFLSLTFLLLVCVCQAQTGYNFTAAWVKTWDGAYHNYDVAEDVKVDAAGNIYVLGLTTISSTENRFVLIKFDTNGTFQWQQLFGSAGTQVVDPMPRMRVDAKGNAYIACTYKTATRGNCFFVTKYDTTGKLIFGNYFDLDPQSEYNDSPTDLAVGNDGSVVVVGYGFDYPVGYGIVLKYSTTGAYAWHQTMFNSYSTSARSVVLDNKGYVYVAADSLIEYGNFAITTYKFLANTGKLLWHFSEPKNSYAAAMSIGLDTQGRVVVYGQKLRSDGTKSIYSFRRSAYDGSIQPSNFYTYPDAGTLNFGTTQTLAATRMAVGSDDTAFCIGQGSVGANNILLVALGGYGGGWGGSGVGATDNTKAVRGADVVADKHGAGFFIGTLPTDMNGIVSEDIRVMRRRNGTGDADYTWRPAIDGKDYGVAIDIDKDEDLICVGHTQNQNVYDIVLFKLVQTPYALPDTYHAYQNRPLQVNAADGLRKNDVGAEKSSVVKQTETTHGALTLYDDGSFVYTPANNFVGYDEFNYYETKGAIMGQGSTVRIWVHPSVTKLVLPTEIVGGEGPAPTAQVFVYTYETGEPLPGTFTTSDPAHVKMPATWTMPSGEYHYAFPFSTLAVTQDTTVTITASRGGTQASSTMVLKPGGLGYLLLAPNNMVGGGTGTGTVRLTGPAPAGGAVVNLIRGPSTNAPFSVTIPAGSVKTTFTFGTGGVAATTQTSISASRGTVKLTTALTLRPPPVLTKFGLSSAAVYGGQNVTATVTLDSNAAQTGTKVNISDNENAVITPTDVVVPVNASTASFIVKTTNVATTTQASITAVLGATSITVGLSLEPSPMISKFSVVTPVTGGTTTTATITLDRAATVGSVRVITSDSSAYATCPSSVLIAKNGTGITFSIPTAKVNAKTLVTVRATLAGVTKSVTLTLNP